MKDLMRKLSGVQTIKSIRSRLNIDRNKAIYIVHRLRKKGYVLTKQDSDNSRIYFIAKENEVNNIRFIVRAKVSNIPIEVVEAHLVI